MDILTRNADYSNEVVRFSNCPRCNKENGLKITIDKSLGYTDFYEEIICKDCLEKGEKINE